MYLALIFAYVARQEARLLFYFYVSIQFTQNQPLIEKSIIFSL